jgi:homoserine dehydrogenase
MNAGEDGGGTVIDPFHVSGSSPGRIPLRVAILGVGTVGSAVAQRLAAGHGAPWLELTHLFDRRAEEKRRAMPWGGTPKSTPIPTPIWTSRIEEVLQSPADLVIETIGGIAPAADWVREALVAGKSVVSANKQLIARHGAALGALAARQGRQLRFEGAVGGAMPIVRAVQDGLSGDRITRIVAILNGTTNAVLSRMEAERCNLPEALADARARGYAEADPSADLDGGDACAKLAILCALAFGIRIDPDRIAARSTASIDASHFDLARRRNGTIRQLAHAEYDHRRAALTAWVAPVVVPLTSLFARTTGAGNAAVITGEHCGDVGMFGAGAGGDATAVAVIGDAIAVARDPAAVVTPPLLRVPRTIIGFQAATVSSPEVEPFLEAEAV